jgi:nucleoid-associated protein YgaU
MGRLEKQIISGAIALVAILLGVVVVKGVDHDPTGEAKHGKSEWQDPTLLMPNLVSEHESGQASRIDLGPSESLLQSPRDLAKEQSLRKIESSPTREMSDPGTDSARAEAIQTEPALSQPKAANFDPNQAWDQQLRVYLVKDGETLSEISMHELGSMKYVDQILEVNEGLQAHRIGEGDEIWLPSQAAAQHSRNLVAGSKPVRAENASAKVLNTKRMHKVVARDSLWHLSKKYYGNSDVDAGIRRIVAANPKLLPDVDAILRLGTELHIPK